MICIACKKNGLRRAEARCTECRRTLGQRTEWTERRASKQHAAPDAAADEARREKQRTWKSPRDVAIPERREITARDLVGGNGRAGAEWLTGGAA